MTDSTADAARTEAVSTEAAQSPPETGNAVIDAALAELSGIEHCSAAEQLERITAAHDVLAQVLETSREAVQTPIPGVRPR